MVSGRRTWIGCKKWARTTLILNGILTGYFGHEICVDLCKVFRYGFEIVWDYLDLLLQFFASNFVRFIRLASCTCV